MILQFPNRMAHRVSRKKRIIMAKMGLDSHDNGLRIVSKWLADDGYEVIYAGVYNSAERILRMIIEENVDALGLSFLGGEHLYYAKKLIGLLRENDLSNVTVFVGGIIPPDGFARPYITWLMMVSYGIA